ncbi:MAG: TerC family protein [Hyphomicrobiales bacterium]|nr:TerC family protein [Hyphomicrobiales bacterium]
MESFGYFAFQMLQIAWLDLLLSGDNAVVIALACRELPDDKKRLGVALGAGAAIALRVIFTVAIDQMLAVPLVKFVGGVLLLGIAVKLVVSGENHGTVKARPSVAGAVLTIMIADGVMSLDNVLAILGVAHGDMRLVVFGLLLSIPLVVFGAGAVMRIIERFPLLVWAGAALLGWVAGEMMAADPIFAAWLDRHGDPPDIVASIVGLVFVLAAAAAIKAFKPARER